MQFSENEDEFSPEVSFQRHGSFSCAAPLSPLLLINSLSRKSFSYNKLPQEPLKLTVIKLDGSSFGIQVTKFATVAELRLAVEGAFSHLPQNGPGEVSWPHVWGNFCLSYDGQKLLADTDYIRSCGIQDGDKLYFIRHRSIYYDKGRTRSGKRASALEQPRISNGCEPKKKVEKQSSSCSSNECEQIHKVEKHSPSCSSNGCEHRKKVEKHSSSCRSNGCEQRKKVEKHNHCCDERSLNHRQAADNKGVMVHCEFGMTRRWLRGGWSSFSRLKVSDKKFDSKGNPSRYASNSFSGTFKNLVRLSSDNDFQRETWKGDY